MALKIEICVDSVGGVRAAKDSGADRVELCADLLEGGITPSAGLVAAARGIAGIGLHMMIRPRGGDFLYDRDEVASMEYDIGVAKGLKADGVVFGMLTADGAIDRDLTRRLVQLSRPLSVTFHRAFDMAADPVAALDALIDLGVDRVLTSGQEATAFEGADLIAALVKRAAGRIVVMPGGGITAKNVARVLAATGAGEVHFAALAEQEGGMRFRRPDVFMGGELRPPEFTRRDTDPATLAGIIRASRG